VISRSLKHFWKSGRDKLGIMETQMPDENTDDVWEEKYEMEVVIGSQILMYKLQAFNENLTAHSQTLAK
jgi:hypothetical protein